MDNHVSVRRAAAVWAAVLAVAAAAGFSGSAFASHWWYCSGSTPWHYANYYIYWYNGGTGDYYNIYQEEAKTDADSWSPYTDVFLAQASASGSTDHINAYSGFYGSTGWLGIAEIRGYSGCVVTNGRVRLNRSYLDYGYSRTNREHVACQEIGHLLGLNHNRGSTTTCMNDTILSAPQPNTHDRDMVNSIY
jgi:hypothetical protein